MSHSFYGPSDKTSFLYNSDLSGDVRIVVEDGAGGYEELEVPGEDLLAFVAEHVRRRKIGALEDADDADVLGIQDESSNRKDGR